MDVVVRSRRLVLTRVVAVAALAMAGCHAEEPPIGMSSMPHAAPIVAPRAVDGGAPGEAKLVPSDFREHMTRVVARAPSQGHADRFDAVVWANDAARDAWAGAGDFPDGSTLVEETIERTDRGDRPAGYLVMDKREGAWRYRVAEPDGREAKEVRVSLCATCHSEAPRDSVFRLNSVPQSPAP